MSLIRVETDQLLVEQTSYDKAQPALQKFIADMDADRSSFFHLPARSSWAQEIERLQPSLAQRMPEVDTFIHLGIGGSSLGAETIIRALAPVKAPTFHFLDNIDPDHLWDVLEQTAPARTLVYAVTKSGTTMETLSQLIFIYQWLEKHLGAETAKKHLVFCTDPDKGALRQLAGQWNVPTFDIPTNLGGRFSALGPVGLFPALVAGIDCKGLLRGAYEYRENFLKQISEKQVPAAVDLAYRLVQHYLRHDRNITVLMPYSQKLKCLSSWFTQLWAESLGKGEKGMTPIPATGATDQHSILQLLRDGPHDKVVGFVEIMGFQHLLELKWQGPRLDAFEAVSGITLNQLMDAEFNATRQVLTNNKRPYFTVSLPRLNANTLGQLLYFFEVLTAVAGYCLEIDPFDQPGVEEGKKLTQERIRACKKNQVT
ncbi:MAG: glucose-6-phosphate isomerase [Bdellovibrionota bacterium]